MGARGRLPGCHDLGPPPTLRRDDSAICYPDGLGVEAEMVSHGLARDCEVQRRTVSRRRATGRRRRRHDRRGISRAQLLSAALSCAMATDRATEVPTNHDREIAHLSPRGRDRRGSGLRTQAFEARVAGPCLIVESSANTPAIQDSDAGAGPADVGRMRRHNLASEACCDEPCGQRGSAIADGLPGLGASLPPSRTARERERRQV